MNYFQEWTDQLIKTNPKTKISKTALVEVDNSYLSLYELLLKGYDTVKWLQGYEGVTPCPLCQALADQMNAGNGVSLASFLGFAVQRYTKLDENGNTVPELTGDGLEKIDLIKRVEIYRNAPIYNFSHVGCRCALLITREAPVPTQYTGESFSPKFITVKGLS